MKLTTVTQFGARVGLAKLHVEKLLKACKNKKRDINHIFYLVDPENKKLGNYLKSTAAKYDNITLYTRNDNDWTEFRRLKKRAPFGGDCNYDFLIRRPETTGTFLTLHDDSIISNCDLLGAIQKCMEGNHFAGYLDTRTEIDTYGSFSLDGQKMSDIRIGTWFTIGKTDHYLKQQYTIGDYRNYWKYHIWARYGLAKRLKFHKQKIWLNGGFDWNIRARLEGDKVQVLDELTNHKPLAEHLTKITGFFAATKRNMLVYVDRDDELTQWEGYVGKLKRAGDSDQVEFDKRFMMNLAQYFEDAGVYDPLLNLSTLEDLFK